MISVLNKVIGKLKYKYYSRKNCKSLWR